MPEGPSVRRFHHLVSPFVGQQVVKTGGSSKKLNPAGLQLLWLQDAQVKIILRFDPDEEIVCPRSSPLSEPLHDEEHTEEARHHQEVSDLPSQSAGGAHVVPGGDDGPPQCVGGDSPAGGAERWLQVSFGLFGSVWVNEFSRAKKANKKGDWKDPIPRLVLHFGGGGFLAFYNCQMAWSCSSPVVSPASDILSEKFHRGQALEALGMVHGNIIKNEALFRAGIHPLTPGSLLGALRLEALVDHVVAFSAGWLEGKFQGRQQHTQIYQKDRCPAGHQVVKEALGPPGGLQRLTWWCPQCQPRLPAAGPEQVQPP
uniref:Endonuclease 8-like 2 n=1 Tax=Sus scrofa TaxID=9823 RepID=A0A8D1P729_PIG